MMSLSRRNLLALGSALMARHAVAADTKANTILVFAAVSLTDALIEIAGKFEASSGVSVKTSFAASSALARQIESGAPADIFFSADRDWMDELQSHGLIQPASRVDLLGNRLVLVAPQGTAVKLRIEPGTGLRDMLGDARWATGDPDSVPVGRYARAALQRLGAWDAISGRLVRTDNVRAALALVARGEVAFGIVYQTDALIESRVRVVDVFPADSHPAIVYPVALTRSAGAAAEPFMHYLRSPAASEVFRRFGFLTPSPSTPAQ